MIFALLTDKGWHTPFSAANFQAAADQVKQDFGRGDGQIKMALFLPAFSGTLTQADDAANATFTATGDSATQKTIRDNLATYLALQSPTNAQTLAAVRALARLVVGDFTGST